VISISGHGFTYFFDTKIVIRPTTPSSYKLLQVYNGTIRVLLKPGEDWLPSYLSLKGSDDAVKIPLQVISIDTGAGEVVLENPITVGFIVKDREGVVCDDSCEFAFDGVCDDGSEDTDDGETNNIVGEDNLQEELSFNDNFRDDVYRVSVCVKGTDCTDCGGVDAIFVPPSPSNDIQSCTNTCPYARDGICDDPRGANYCKLGTDCQDCGPLGADNFTRSSNDDGWWDDDDDYWVFDDHGEYISCNAL
jgi:hypothetical protein